MEDKIAYYELAKEPRSLCVLPTEGPSKFQARPDYKKYGSCIMMKGSITS